MGKSVFMREVSKEVKGGTPMIENAVQLGQNIIYNLKINPTIF